MIRFLLAPLVLLAATPALAQSEAPVSTKDAAVFVQQLREMGYSATDLDSSSAFPTTLIKIGDDTLAVSLANCKALKDCEYITVVGVFSDVTNPPADWVAKENSEFDVIKVWLNDKGTLTYSVGTIVEGWPRSTFRAWIDLIGRSAATLASDAISAKLVKQ